MLRDEWRFNEQSLVIQHHTSLHLMDGAEDDTLLLSI